MCVGKGLDRLLAFLMFIDAHVISATRCPKSFYTGSPRFHTLLCGHNFAQELYILKTTTSIVYISVKRTPQLGNPLCKSFFITLREDEAE